MTRLANTHWTDPVLKALYDITVAEPCDEFEAILKRLPDGSDDSSVSGSNTDGGPTSSGSVDSALCAGSLSIPGADAQSHNLNARLSTPGAAKRFQ